jgi:hypothetical protein
VEKNSPTSNLQTGQFSWGSPFTDEIDIPKYAEAIFDQKGFYGISGRTQNNPIAFSINHTVKTKHL